MSAKKKQKVVKWPLNVWWMIQTKDGEFWHNTSRHHRSLCISDFVRDCQASYRDPPYMPTWRDLRKEGYRCVKTQIKNIGGSK